MHTFADGASNIKFGVNNRTHIVKGENDTVTFVCRLESNPSSTMTIERNNRVLGRHTNVSHLTYTIDRLSCEAGGTYSCTGSNEFNIDCQPRKDLQLNVLCKYPCNLFDTGMSLVLFVYILKYQLLFTIYVTIYHLCNYLPSM